MDVLPSLCATCFSLVLILTLLDFSSCFRHCRALSRCCDCLCAVRRRRSPPRVSSAWAAKQQQLAGRQGRMGCHRKGRARRRGERHARPCTSTPQGFSSCCSSPPSPLLTPIPPLACGWRLCLCKRTRVLFFFSLQALALSGIFLCISFLVIFWLFSRPLAVCPQHCRRYLPFLFFRCPRASLLRSHGRRWLCGSCTPSGPTTRWVRRATYYGSLFEPRQTGSRAPSRQLKTPETNHH